VIDPKYPSQREVRVGASRLRKNASTPASSMAIPKNCARWMATHCLLAASFIKVASIVSPPWVWI
jgi:hypothetical protein